MLKKVFSRSVIGLAVRTEKLYLIQARKHHQKIVIENVLTQDLPSAAVIDDQIIEWRLLPTALQSAVTQHQLEGHVVLGIPGKLAIMRTIETPAGLKTHEIHAAIQRDIHIQLPAMKDTLRIDFAVSPKSMQNTTLVCYAAAKQTYVAELVNCIQKIGLKVQAVDVEDCALIRAFYQLKKVNKGLHGVLYCREAEICFILFTAYEIISNECWKLSDAMDVQRSLDYKLNTLKQQHPHLQSLTFRAPTTTLHSFIRQRCANWISEINLVDNFNHLNFVQTHQQHLLNENFSNWIIPYGLALRGFV